MDICIENVKFDNYKWPIRKSLSLLQEKYEKYIILTSQIEPVFLAITCITLAIFIFNLLLPFYYCLKMRFFGLSSLFKFRVCKDLYYLPSCPIYKVQIFTANFYINCWLLNRELDFFSRSGQLFACLGYKVAPTSFCGMLSDWTLQIMIILYNLFIYHPTLLLP